MKSLIQRIPEEPTRLVIYVLTCFALLVGLSALVSAQQVATYNPTGQDRSEWVVFGSENRDPQRTFRDLGAGSFLNVGRVNVPPRHDGMVTLDPDMLTEEFVLHEAITSAIGSQGFWPTVEVNGDRADLVPIEMPIAHRRVLVHVWRARVKSGVVELVTYTFHRQASVRFELAFFCESLTQPKQNVTLSIAFSGMGPMVFPWVYDWDRGTSNPTAPKKLLDNRSLADAQGVAWHGLVAFYSQRMLSDPLDIDTRTAFAQIEHPLYAVSKWDKIGFWGRGPMAVTKAKVDQLHAGNSGKPYGDPLAWIDAICNRRPADTGEQGEFGTWHHVPTWSVPTAKLSWQDARADMREICRPIWMHEPDGSWVKSAAHKAWVSWFETTHWHVGVSTDRLGRTHAGPSEADSSGWQGHDWQHEGWIRLGEHVRLHGSILGERLLRRVTDVWFAGLTLPSEKPGYATNDPDHGRAIGRTALAIAHVVGALPKGDPLAKALMDRWLKRYDECVEPQWRKILARGNGPVKAYTIVTNDPRTSFPTSEVWVPWQDGIAAAGMDAFCRVLDLHGRTAEASKLRAFVIQVGESFVTYGYEPGGVLQAVSYCPIPGNNPPANFRDPTLCLMADGTDFSKWGLMCVGVIQQLTQSQAVKDRCAAIRAKHESAARDTYSGSLR